MLLDGVGEHHPAVDLPGFALAAQMAPGGFQCVSGIEGKQIAKREITCQSR